MSYCVDRKKDQKISDDAKNNIGQLNFLT